MEYLRPVILKPSTSRRSRVVLGDFAELRKTDLSRHSGLFIIAGRRTAKHWLRPVQRALPKVTASIVIPTSEAGKSVATAERLWQRLHWAGADRHALIINLGGGVITDLGGFVAATYLRGVSFIHIPTTLMAQADAAIGGKVGVNAFGLKNMVGSFAQPELVLCNPKTLSTLPPRQLRSGWAEIIKHALIADRRLFDRLVELPLPASTDDLVSIIATSVRHKVAVVQSDEREAGPRALLNFGHTIGHAVEAASHRTSHPLLHGEAVAIGMYGEALVSHTVGTLPAPELDQIQQTLGRFGLPSTIPAKLVGPTLRRLPFDKKRRGPKLEWVLLERVGKARRGVPVPTRTVNEAVRRLVQP